MFSGYLSAVKLFSGSCAFNEPCPYFLGYPACWYGFALYLIIFIATLLALTDIIEIVSALGIIFSGSFAVREIAAGQITGVLGFSTYVYGFIFFAAIFIVSLFAAGKGRRMPKTDGAILNTLANMITTIHVLWTILILGGTILVIFYPAYAIIQIAILTFTAILNFILMNHCPLTFCESYIRKKIDSSFDNHNSFMMTSLNKIFKTHLTPLQSDVYIAIFFAISYAISFYRLWHP